MHPTRRPGIHKQVGYYFSIEIQKFGMTKNRGKIEVVGPAALRTARVPALLTETIKETGFQTRSLPVNTCRNVFNFLPCMTTQTKEQDISHK